MLRGRVVIGRRQSNHICIPDRTVSRIHAWIGQANESYFVMDTGSRAGTRVNGRPIAARADLSDGDRIRIGTVDITFRSEARLPPGVEEIDLSDRKLDSGDGIFVDCKCGAPLWAPWDFGGRVGQCRYCGQMVSLPKSATKPANTDLSSETVFGGMPAIRDDDSAPPKKVSVTRRSPAAPPKPSLFDGPPAAKLAAPAPAVVERSAQSLCGACQSPISLLEETTRCPECGVAFHADCWKENCGCSSYGCSQVGALAKTLYEPAFQKELVVGDPVELEESPRRIAWEYLLLAGSVLAAAIGSLTFGLPAALVLIGVGWAWPNVAYRSNRRTLVLAAVISLLASIGGAWFSWYWWLDAVPVVGGGR